jgi:hypothetical protein
MKLSVLAAATMFVLSGTALAQTGDNNGLSLGKSAPGSNAGVPYPNPATTDRSAPVAGGGTKQPSAPAPKHHKKSGT